MAALNQKLGTKIVNILIVFFFVALAAIGMTLYISWQLEGAGAAINDAGSARSALLPHGLPAVAKHPGKR